MYNSLNTCFRFLPFVLALFEVLLLQFKTPFKKTEIEVIHLRCEYMTNPLGIDNTHPALSWELVSPHRNKRQTAYEIVVASDTFKINNFKADIWSTGKIKSSETKQIIFAGNPLESGEMYYWKVRVWDESGNSSGWSEIQFWSTGMLDSRDWKAQWIGAKPIDPITDQDKYVIPPSPLLRKSFNVAKNIQRATLYATALGVYQVYLNGEKAGDYILAPEWTDYSRRVQYQTYDVTALTKQGDNVLGAVLADGWYAGSLWSHFYRGKYGLNRRFFAQLNLEYTDGTKEIITSDAAWKILNNGPIRESSIFDGEVFDERFNPQGWMNAGFDDSKWDNVYVDKSVSVNLNAQPNPPIRVVKQLHPINAFEVRKNRYDPTTCIFDMGQNMAGRISLKLPVNPGRKIVIRYAEMLNPDSTLYTANLRNAKPADIYIPGKEHSIEFEPAFTYHGFRYIEITGLSKLPGLTEITCKVLASSSPIVSAFETSSEDINRLWNNILWTQLGNMHGIPTDCPQRDERCGWMGDAQVFAQSAMYNMDMEAFYTKWLRDIRDEQTSEGRLPNYAPYITGSLRYYDAPGWTDASIIIPWEVYLNYGNKRILSDNFEMMRKFIDNICIKNPSLIRINEVGQNYGDHLNGNTIKSPDYPAEGGAIPTDVFNTAYFAYSARLLSNICKVLQQQKYFRHYDSLATAVRSAFIKNFIEEDGTVKGNTQAGYALALEFDLVPGHLKQHVVQKMIDALKAYSLRISTGIHTTERLMNQISINGFNDIAYRLLESHRFPSWLYSIDQGATTIWERWDGYVKGRGFQDENMNSFNHYALGAIGEWMYKYILGIRPDESSPGYKHFFIQPVPGGSLRWAKGFYHSVAGTIGVNWEQTNGLFNLEVTIPVNTTATIYLPSTDTSAITESGSPLTGRKDIRIKKNRNNNVTCTIGSGQYQFQVKYNQQK